MSAAILDGKNLAGKIKQSLTDEIKKIKSQTGKVPRLMNILVGDDHGSCAYANSQRKVAQEIGVEYELKTLPKDISQDTFAEFLQERNCDEAVHGIMIHKPLPEHIDYQVIANHLAIEKDLEGINVANIGRMLLGQTNMIPCTPAAVLEHIKSSEITIRGKEVVIVGASDIVGKPLSLLLLRQYATVSVCHIATSEVGALESHVKRADILIVAVGKASLIKGDWIKEGAIVIDVGINRVDDKIVGDVDFESAKLKASFITPVPGGVGPVTVVMLMRNGLEAFKKQL